MNKRRLDSDRTKKWSVVTLALAAGIAVNLGAAGDVQASSVPVLGMRSGGGAGNEVAPPRRFALVIGSNDTLDKQQSRLRFADDDAAKMAELLAMTGAEVELLTTFDRESQERFSGWVKRAHRPSHSEVMRAFERLSEQMKAAASEGPVDFLVYYSGHGDVGPDGQGYLTLEGGKLSRHDLFQHFLSRSSAKHNHILIDACRSEEFVLSRGDWKPDRGPAAYEGQVREYLSQTQLANYPNTGVLLARSVDQQTHEWERYRGGVFTHELLSGLRGGADLNGDGQIEYSELGAFVAAANSGVDDPRAHLAVVVRPPADDERTPVVAHERVAEQRVLYFSTRDRGRYTVEDARGVRLADLRRSGEQPSYLRLPKQREIFVLRHDDSPEEKKNTGSSNPLFERRLGGDRRPRLQ